MQYSTSDIDRLAARSRAAIAQLSTNIGKRDDPIAKTRLAALLFAFAKGPADKVSRLLAESLASRPSAEGYYWQGQLRFAEGDVAGAEQSLLRVLESEPDHPLASLLLVSVHRSRRLAPEITLAAAARVASLAPSWPNAHLLLGKSRFEIGDLEGAQASLLEAIANADSVQLPTNPLSAFLEHTETGRLGTDVARLVRRLGTVRTAIATGKVPATWA